MGYKRAGFDVIGNVEIDPKINAMYVKNHQPKFNYCMDLRDFNKLKELPEFWMVLRRAARFLWLGCENGHGIRKKYLGKARNDSGWMIYFLCF